MTVETTRPTQEAAATVGVTAVAITDVSFGWDAGRVEAAQRAVVSASAGIRYWYGGATPTATQGHPISADGSRMFVGNGSIKDLQFIRTGGSDAIVSITLEA